MSEEPRFRIVLADDNEAICRIATLILKDEFELVGQASDGKMLVELVTALIPDICVLDISMPTMNGFDAAILISERFPDLRIVFLTVHEDPDFVEAAFASGGDAYVVKSRLDRDLPTAIHEALEGRHFVSPGLPLY